MHTTASVLSFTNGCENLRQRNPLYGISRQFVTSILLWEAGFTREEETGSERDR